MAVANGGASRINEELKGYDLKAPRRSNFCLRSSRYLLSNASSRSSGRSARAADRRVSDVSALAETTLVDSVTNYKICAAIFSLIFFPSTDSNTQFRSTRFVNYGDTIVPKRKVSIATQILSVERIPYLQPSYIDSGVRYCVPVYEDNSKW